ncbi:MAG: hypothetical protein AAF941_02380 [Pseudomonadota bacterium]
MWLTPKLGTVDCSNLRAYAAEAFRRDGKNLDLKVREQADAVFSISR